MTIEKNFPMLPLRDVVVYPQLVIPLFVGREKSISAIEKANSIGLYSTGVNTYVIEDLKHITEELALYCEKLILDTALYKGSHFRPIYLNKKIN